MNEVSKWKSSNSTGQGRHDDKVWMSQEGNGGKHVRLPNGVQEAGKVPHAA